MLPYIFHAKRNRYFPVTCKLQDLVCKRFLFHSQTVPIVCALFKCSVELGLKTRAPSTRHFPYQRQPQCTATRSDLPANHVPIGWWPRYLIRCPDGWPVQAKLERGFSSQSIQRQPSHPCDSRKILIQAGGPPGACPTEKCSRGCPIPPILWAGWGFSSVNQNTVQRDTRARRTPFVLAVRVSARLTFCAAIHLSGGDTMPQCWQISLGRRTTM